MQKSFQLYLVHNSQSKKSKYGPPIKKSGQIEFCAREIFIRMEDENGQGGNVVTEYSSYEDFLDSQITATDLYYLEDEELARQLVELGYRGSGEVLKREEFEQRKVRI